jgi:hypothetical protein
MTNPTPLSPAAQAVLDAFRSSHTGQGCLAAALRAAADQVVPGVDEPDWGACNEMRCDIELYTDHQRKRATLLAIAAELDGANNTSENGHLQ